MANPEMSELLDGQELEQAHTPISGLRGLLGDFFDGVADFFTRPLVKCVIHFVTHFCGGSFWGNFSFR